MDEQSTKKIMIESPSLAHLGDYREKLKFTLYLKMIVFIQD